jgi:hypothetical protein
MPDQLGSAVTIAVVVIMVIVVVAANDHNWSTMTAGISIMVSVPELNRYAPLLRDHHWPIIPGLGKRRTCQEGDCGSGKN